MIVPCGTLGGKMKPGLGRGLDSLLKVYDDEVVAEPKQEFKERSITNL